MADPSQPTSSNSENTGSRLGETAANYYVPVGGKRSVKKVGDKNDKSDMAWVDAADGTSRPRISIKSLIILILGSLAAIATLAVILKSQPNTADQSPPPLITEVNDGPPVFTQPPREIADAILASTDPTERLKWVRNPEDVAKHLQFYPEEALSHPVETLSPLERASVQDIVFARYMASFANGNKRLLCVVATENGPKVDWDAYARYGAADWEAITEGTASPVEVRVFLKRGNYYTYSYGDDSVWQCYQVTSPDTKEAIYFYARSDSKGGQLLASTFPEGSNHMQRMTLTISSTEDGLKHGQFNIDRIHAFDWVRSEKDIEEVWIPSPLNKPVKKEIVIPNFGFPAE